MIGSGRYLHLHKAYFKFAIAVLTNKEMHIIEYFFKVEEGMRSTPIF